MLFWMAQKQSHWNLLNFLQRHLFLQQPERFLPGKNFLHQSSVTSPVLMAPILPSVHSKGYQGSNRFSNAGFTDGCL